MGFLADLLLKSALVAVELLDRQGTDDATQVARYRLLDRRLDIVHWHAQKTLGGAPDVVDVALNLHLSHRLDVDRNALDGIDVRHIDFEGHHSQRKDLILLPRRPHERATAANDTEAFDLALFGADLFPEQFAATENNQRFVRTGLLVAYSYQKIRKEEHHRDHDQKEEEYFATHDFTSGFESKSSLAMTVHT